jgi:hypothetical protein
MAKRAEKDHGLEGLLKELIAVIEQQTIVSLGLKGIPQAKIRAVVGGDIKRVNSILKHLKGHTA